VVIITANTKHSRSVVNPLLLYFFLFLFYRHGSGENPIMMDAGTPERHSRSAGNSGQQTPKKDTSGGGGGGGGGSGGSGGGSDDGRIGEGDMDASNLRDDASTGTAATTVSVNSIGRWLLTLICFCRLS
jgi:hypothetical protein